MDRTNDQVWAEINRRDMLNQARLEAAKLTLATFVATVAADVAMSAVVAKAGDERLLMEPHRPADSYRS